MRIQSSSIGVDKEIPGRRRHQLLHRSITMNILLWIYLTFFRTQQLSDQERQQNYKDWAELPLVSCKKCNGRGKLTLTAKGICCHCDRLMNGFEYPDIESFRQPVFSISQIPMFMWFQIFMIGLALSIYIYRFMYHAAV